MDEDLFVPMFSRSSMDNPHTGCRSFLDRQFWSAIKVFFSLYLEYSFSWSFSSVNPMCIYLRWCFIRWNYSTTMLVYL